MVGPVLAEDAKPLPADPMDFLDQGLSGHQGAVFASALLLMGCCFHCVPNESSKHSLIFWITFSHTLGLQLSAAVHVP